MRTTTPGSPPSATASTTWPAWKRPACRRSPGPPRAVRPDSPVCALSHILARVVQFAAFHQGTQIAHLGDLTQVPAELAAYQPTIVLAVPRVFEKLYNTAQRKALASGRARVFDAAARTAVAYSQALDTGALTAGLRIRHRLFDRLVYTKLRAAMGGRVHYAVSGGAPLGHVLGHFLRCAGVHILEGYGLTETTAAITLNLPGAQRIGTVGLRDDPSPWCREPRRSGGSAFSPVSSPLETS
ncbi:MAG TPA: AMP-binding protein [Jiangellaceae bacterium]